MTPSQPFTVHRSPFTMRYPFTVIRGAQRLRANGKCTVNTCPTPKPERSSAPQAHYGVSRFGAGDKWLMVNGTGGAS